MEQQETKFKFPTEVIELPSKGLLYPEENPLSAGKIEMKYMTAKEEDILTNQSYIQNGTVLDKLLKALIVTKINYDDIVIGDKNALMVASRILGYGADYTFKYANKTYTIDLSKIENKNFDESLITPYKNEFQFTLPTSNIQITFKILTHSDELKINQELEGLKKLGRELSPELSTRLKYIITSVNGNSDTKTIRDFVDTSFLAKDSRALREYISKIQPDVDLKFITDSGQEAAIPITLSFFWPDL
jgi:hypothetical protein